MSPKAKTPEELLMQEIARLRAGIMAVAFGLAGGTLLFVVTAWLLMRGGEVVGPHLALLNVYFPGYSVTWPGAVVGFAYGAVVSAAAGWSIAFLYNAVANRRLSSFARSVGADA